MNSIVRRRPDSASGFRSATLAKSGPGIRQAGRLREGSHRRTQARCTRRAAGREVYTGTQFPESYHNQIFIAERWLVEPQGASWLPGNAGASGR